MPVCPNCNTQISHLRCIESGSESSVFEFKIEKGELEYSDHEFEPDGDTQEYNCPECGHTISLTEKHAVEFLKGNDIPL